MSSHHVGCVAGTVPTKFASALVETPEMAEANKNRTFLKRLGTPQVRYRLDYSLIALSIPTPGVCFLIILNCHVNSYMVILPSQQDAA